MKKRTAFTLIELLVVVSIIALLIGILLPSLNKARAQGQRISCAAQLHQVGIAMMAYLQDSRDRMPYISFMPSYGPAPLDTDRPIYLADVLGRFLQGKGGALQCPNDLPGRTERPAPNMGLSFFQSERASYGYRTDLRGLTPTEFNERDRNHWHQPDARRHNERKVAPNVVWFACDYDNFHGRAVESGARRYVYIDGHVSQYEN